MRPDDDVVLVDDPTAAVDAVGAGRVDAALVDLSTALVLTKGRDDVTTGGMFVTDGEMAIALPKGSDNVEVVDAALKALDADRTIHDLAREVPGSGLREGPGIGAHDQGVGRMTMEEPTCTS